MASLDMFRELDNIRREMDEAFRGAGLPRSLRPTFLSPASARRFPLLNVSEDEGHVYLEALLPGVEPGELELTVLGNTITISGERKPLELQPGQVLHRTELGSGRFSRTLELPVEIDQDRISAEYRHGVVQISMAKAEHAKPRKVEISVS